MIDVRDVTVFASKLRFPVPKDEWRDKWSEKVADEMRNTAPEDTGALKASIQVVPEGVEVGVDYAAFVEYGTGDTSPQPFAGPAANRLAPPAAEDLGDMIIRLYT
jgi:HK97 gp10 family phage protein